jgi:hypothetical protein
MLGLFGQSSLRRWQLYLFDEQGKLYPAILVVDGNNASAFVPGDDPVRIFDISSLTITQARKMGFKVIYAKHHPF